MTSDRASRARWFVVSTVCALLLGGSMTSAGQSSGERSVFVSITPCRVLDTRPAPNTVGLRSTPLGAGDTHDVAVDDGNCAGQIPAGVSSVSLNVTTVAATELTFITVWATGDPQPKASSLNPSPGQPPTPNAVITAVSDDGRFNVYNLTGAVHVLADINGYYLDHDHDDRYYTKAESDDRYLRPDPLQVVIGAPAFAGTYYGEWEYSKYSLQSTYVNGTCAYADVDLPHGATVTRIRVRVKNPEVGLFAPVNLYRLPLTGFDLETVAEVSVPGGSTQILTVTNEPALNEPVDLSSYRYVAEFCSLNATLYDVLLNYAWP